MHATQANRRPLVVDLVDINFAPTVAGGLILIIQSTSKPFDVAPVAAWSQIPVRIVGHEPHMRTSCV